MKGEPRPPTQSTACYDRAIEAPNEPDWRRNFDGDIGGRVPRVIFPSGVEDASGLYPMAAGRTMPPLVYTDPSSTFPSSHALSASRSIDNLLHEEGRKPLARRLSMWRKRVIAQLNRHKEGAENSLTHLSFSSPAARIHWAGEPPANYSNTSKAWRVFFVTAGLILPLMAIFLILLFSVILPRQIQSILYRAVIIPKDVTLKPRGIEDLEFKITASLSSSSPTRGTIFFPNGLNLHYLEMPLQAQLRQSGHWWDPLDLREEAEREVYIGNVFIHPLDAGGVDQVTLQGDILIEDSDALGSAIQLLMKGVTVPWVLEGFADVQLLGLSFTNLPFTRALMIEGIPLLKDKIPVENPERAENLMLVGGMQARESDISLGLPASMPFTVTQFSFRDMRGIKSSDLLFSVQLQVDNPAMLEIESLGAAQIDLYYDTNLVGALQGDDLVFRNGENKWTLEGRLHQQSMGGIQLINDILAGKDCVMMAKFRPNSESDVLVRALGSSLTIPAALGSLSGEGGFSPLILSTAVKSTELVDGHQPIQIADSQGRVILPSSGTMSRAKFPSFPDSVLSVMSRFERRLGIEMKRERRTIERKAKRLLLPENHRRHIDSEDVDEGRAELLLDAYQNSVSIGRQLGDGRLFRSRNQGTGNAVGSIFREAISPLLGAAAGQGLESLFGNGQRIESGSVSTTGQQNNSAPLFDTLSMVKSITGIIGRNIINAVRDSSVDYNQLQEEPRFIFGGPGSNKAVWDCPLEGVIYDVLQALSTDGEKIVSISGQCAIGVWHPFVSLAVREATIKSLLSVQSIRNGAWDTVGEMSARARSKSSESDYEKMMDEILLHRVNNSFHYREVEKRGLLNGRHDMVNVEFQGYSNLDSNEQNGDKIIEKWSRIAQNILESNYLGIRLGNLGFAAETILDDNVMFSATDDNVTLEMSFAGIVGSGINYEIAKIEIPEDNPEVVVEIELAIRSDLPMKLKSPGPIYMDWGLRDLGGGPLTIPSLEISPGNRNKVKVVAGFYREKLGGLMLPVIFDLLAKASVQLCFGYRSEYSNEELEVQRVRESSTGRILDAIIGHLRSYCVEVPLGALETQMAGEIVLPFMARLSQSLGPDSSQEAEKLTEYIGRLQTKGS